MKRCGLVSGIGPGKENEKHWTYLHLSKIPDSAILLISEMADVSSYLWKVHVNPK